MEVFELEHRIQFQLHFWNNMQASDR